MNIPSDYQTLRDVVSDCLERIGLIEDSKNVFESKRVRDHLEGTMQLIIQALELIFQYISTPTLRKYASDTNTLQF